ncbi:LacI family DNA-binding transcriptional regulator [Auraticoccus cholistanensis]|uniref:LacI family DNA-binding transcriptional regulator n=1 Tax=Auraticoccus cholistanensis TaxID=2656650 RepID=UPI0018D2579E
MVGRDGVRKVTSQDVARRAGVSRAAVSLVLNGRGSGNIAPEKQELIRAAARELGYVPNAAAVNLRVQRTRTIGLVTDTIATTAFGGAVVAGAMERAGQDGYLTMVVDTEDDPDAEARAFEALQHRQVDGLMFAAQSLREHPVDHLVGATPAVLANCVDPGGHHGAWFPDEVAGGRLATRAVLERGHRDIACLTGAAQTMATGLRARGFELELADAGVTGCGTHPCGWEIRDGHRVATALLSRPDRPTALVCANDRVAIGAVLAATALGLSVPQDVSVVGYDDDENAAPAMVPALTTVGLPHREMGEQAMGALLAQLAGEPHQPAQVAIPGPLIQRDSVAAPPARVRPGR